jgi:hypothetical protein
VEVLSFEVLKVEVLSVEALKVEILFNRPYVKVLKPRLKSCLFVCPEVFVRGIAGQCVL